VEKVDINSQDAYNNTPVYLASLCGHPRVLRYLLDNDAVCMCPLIMCNCVMYTYRSRAFPFQWT